MSRLVQFGLPGYVSSEGCWLGGVKGVETILGNPLNRVTGEKSVFIGASQSNPGEVSSVRRERPREGIDTRVDLSRCVLHGRCLCRTNLGFFCGFLASCTYFLICARVIS